MNYEKFNDAMCRLRQAEEEFNRKLQEAFKPFIDEINRIDKEEQQADLRAKIDEAYNKGIQDLYNALGIFKEMPDNTIIDTFGSMFLTKIIQNISPQDLMYKLNQWKAEKEQKEQELHVGDEVTTANGLVGIIIDVGDNSGVVWITYRITPAARGLDSCWVSKIKCKKTGRNFDSIPFDYNPEKEEENK